MGNFPDCLSQNSPLRLVSCFWQLRAHIAFSCGPGAQGRRCQFEEATPSLLSLSRGSGMSCCTFSCGLPGSGHASGRLAPAVDAPAPQFLSRGRCARTVSLFWFPVVRAQRRQRSPPETDSTGTAPPEPPARPLGASRPGAPGPVCLTAPRGEPPRPRGVIDGAGPAAPGVRLRRPSAPQRGRAEGDRGVGGPVRADRRLTGRVRPEAPRPGSPRPAAFALTAGSGRPGPAAGALSAGAGGGGESPGRRRRCRGR